jgi:hypothetical protein
MTVFNSETASFLINPAVNGQPLPRHIHEYRIKELEANMVEQLLLFGKVALQVPGKNLTLAFIIERGGIRLLDELVAQDALEFVMWPVFIMSMVREGADDREVIVSGYHNDDIYNDPEKSLSLSIADLTQNGLSERKAKHLLRKLRDQYVMPNIDLAKKSKELTEELYEQGRLQKLGIPLKQSWSDVTNSEAAQIALFASNILETAAITEFDYLGWKMPVHELIYRDSVREILVGGKVSEDVQRILTVEKIPDIKSLVLGGHLNLEKASILRKTSIAEEFRDWLQNVERNPDNRDILKRYIDTVAGKDNFFQTPQGKIMKTMGMSFLGAAAGKYLGDAGLAGTLLGFGFGLFDAFIVANLLRGKNPRYFIEKLDSVSKSKTP